MTGQPVYALYPDPAAAQRAVNGLRAAGVADQEIVVISSAPFEGFEFSHRDQATWLYGIAVLGGAIGLVFAYWLTSMTETAWPLQTGGMPIVAMWPNMIVMFELTMLGAIVATVLALLVTTRLPRRQPTLYDEAVSDGLILVGIQQPRPSSLETVKSALLAAGGRLH